MHTVFFILRPYLHLCFIYPRLSGPGCVPEDEAYIPTYLEAFPPLPEKGAPGEKAGEPASAWGSKIRPIKASVITQVRLPQTTYCAYLEQALQIKHKCKNTNVMTE